jgi:hypothetical protein
MWLYIVDCNYTVIKYLQILLYQNMDVGRDTHKKNRPVYTVKNVFLKFSNMSIKSQTESQQLLTCQYLKFIKVLLNFH